MTALSDETKARLLKVGTATVSTQLLKRGFRNVYMENVRPLDADTPRLVGEAFTVRYIPAREDLATLAVLGDRDYPQRKAVESIGPGQVLVSDCRGLPYVGSSGDILMTRMQVRGAAGFVSDGAVRDAREIAKLGFPVYCAGPASPANVTRHHAVGLGEPIACGGVAVFPGDVLVGDGDGIVVLPRDIADEVARDAEEQDRLERFVIAEVRAGKSIFGVYPPNEATLARYAKWKE